MSLPKYCFPGDAKINKVSFQRNGSSIVSTFSFHVLKGRKCSVMNRKHCFKSFSKNINMVNGLIPEP